MKAIARWFKKPLWFWWVMAILFLSTPLATAQQILTGRVYDNKTKEPIMGVAVYVAGTSTGVATGPDGDFKIPYDPALKAALVFSYLGYEKVQIADPLAIDLSSVFLVEEERVLDPVFINPDPWDRATKEELFLKYFVGKRSLPHCEIRNLEDVRLRFNTDDAMLTATAQKPIIIVNNYLGYVQSYDLAEFEIAFDYLNQAATPLESFEKIHARQFYTMKSTFISGTAFYRELSGNKPSERRRKRRRDKAFESSQIRLNRSIISESLSENDFLMFYKGFRVDPAKHIRVRESQGIYQVTFRNLRYTFIDARDNQSDLILNENYMYFNKYGISLSPRKMSLVGYIPELGVGGMMPLDYNYIKTQE